VKVAVTGSSGLIGSALLPALGAAGHAAVRLVRGQPGPGELGWDPAGGSIDAAGLSGVDAIVHLAGETIGARWSKERKRRILESRVAGTQLVAETAARLEPPPGVLLCASGIDSYGNRGDEVLTEASPRGEGFLADVVEAWEAAAAPARDAGIRVVHLRQGIVLSRQGGALARLLLPFRLGLGGRIGDGDQWWSWVAMDDVTAAYVRLLELPVSGPVNLVAPEPARNRDFAKALGHALHRPAALPFPSFAVKLLLGEMGEELLLASKRVLPVALEAQGFEFRVRTLADGLAGALAGA
jgi:uncharacterized protein (TIGR01777 family)